MSESMNSAGKSRELLLNEESSVDLSTTKVCAAVVVTYGKGHSVERQVILTTEPNARSTLFLPVGKSIASDKSVRGTAVRKLREETGLLVDEDDLELFDILTIEGMRCFLYASKLSAKQIAKEMRTPERSHALVMSHLVAPVVAAGEELNADDGGAALPDVARTFPESITLDPESEDSYSVSIALNSQGKPVPTTVWYPPFMIHTAVSDSWATIYKSVLNGFWMNRSYPELPQQFAFRYDSCESPIWHAVHRYLVVDPMATDLSNITITDIPWYETRDAQLTESQRKSAQTQPKQDGQDVLKLDVWLTGLPELLGTVGLKSTTASGLAYAVQTLSGKFQRWWQGFDSKPPSLRPTNAAEFDGS